MDGLKALYAGRGMTMWETYEEAEGSWRAPSISALWARTTYPFWRASKIVTVECQPDVSLRDALKEDFKKA